MGFVTDQVFTANVFLYTGQLPLRVEDQLIALFIYALHLAINGGVMFYALKIGGGGSGSFMTDFPKAVFVTLARDLVMIPIIVIVSSYPIVGVLIGAVLWLGLIKYIFNLSWEQGAMVWLISIVLPIVIILFIVIPIALVLLI